MTEGMMGRTSDTRIYNPRSESSTMFRNNDGDGNYNPGDPKYEDEEKQKKQNAREKQEKRERSRKHIKVKPRMLRELDSDEEGQDDSEKIDADREVHAQTGAAGNFGFLSSLAGGAKGPGAARGEMVAMSEAMDDAWSELLKSSAKDRAKRRKKEAQIQFKPSTGEFKRPVGGYDPKTATSRRAKFKSRALGGKSKRTGLGRAHLAVEMEHRGIKTKQPLRLEDPRKYMQQIGRQQVRAQQGQVRTPASPSIPQISGYSTRGMPKPKLTTSEHEWRHNGHGDGSPCASTDADHGERVKALGVGPAEALRLGHHPATEAHARREQEAAAREGAQEEGVEPTQPPVQRTQADDSPRGGDRERQGRPTPLRCSHHRQRCWKGR
jgi:hypothetical protein